jgi:periplasmic mercuric ion binding protein
MKPRLALLPVFLLFAMALPAAAADTKVTLSGVHLCCASCVKGVATAVAPVKGAAATCDQAAGTIAISAPDKETAQSAVNALVAAGYFGKSSDDTIKLDAATGAPDGKVKTLEITGLHLCCGKCVTTVKDVLAKTDGVKDNTVKANAPSFTITGDFDAKSLMAELQKAGLTGKAK